MPIEREGQFLVTHTMGDSPHIGLESATLEQCVTEAATAGYQGVFGSSAFGFNETSLDSLHTLKKLRSIWFWDVALKNVDAVYELSSLKAFGVHPKRPALDFSRLLSLESLTLQPVAGDRGIDALHALKSLYLWHYAPKRKTFDDLELPSNISELEINWANPKDLTGLARNPNLRRLEIHRCRNLESISSLPDLFPSLEHLVITTCRNLDGKREMALAGKLSQLKHAYIQNHKVV